MESFQKPIFLIGMPGVGKSTLGILLSRRLSLPFIDSDKVISTSEGLSITEIFSRYGEVHFRKLECDFLETIAMHPKPRIIATGGGLPCFNNNMDTMNKVGLTLFLNFPLETILKNLEVEEQEKGKIRPLLAGGVGIAGKREKLQILYQTRISYYSQAQHTFTNPEELLSFPFSQYAN